MYSPKIDENQIKKLYQLKLLKKEPITKLVKEAIDNYLDGNLQNHNNLSTNKTILEQNAHFLVELFNKKWNQ